MCTKKYMTSSLTDYFCAIEAVYFDVLCTKRENEGMHRSEIRSGSDISMEVARRDCCTSAALKVVSCRLVMQQNVFSL